MKSHMLPALLLLSLMGVLRAEDLPRIGEPPHPALLLKSPTVEAPAQVRSYALGFFSRGHKADERRRLQRTALDLISLALTSNHTPAAHEDSLSMHGDTGVLVARATEAQHAIIADVIRVLRENMPVQEGIAAAPASSIVRIYALGRIFGISDSGSDQHKHERAARTKALISQIRTSMAMARLDADMPELSFHGSSNSLIAKGTPAQMDLISQAITSWRENTPDHRPVKGL